MKLKLPLIATAARFGETPCVIHDRDGNEVTIIEAHELDDSQDFALASHIARTLNACDGLAPAKIEGALRIVRRLAAENMNSLTDNLIDELIGAARSLNANEKDHCA